MEHLKLSHTIEENVLEFFAWMYLFPITLVHLFFRPLCFLEAMAMEKEKAESARYETRMPPVLFFLFGTMPPSIAIVRHGTLEELTTLPALSDAALIIALTLSILPFAWAISVLVFSARGYDRAQFRDAFSIQCYLFCPIWLFILCVAYYYGPPDVQMPTQTAYAVLGIGIVLIIWLFITEWRLLRKRAISTVRTIGCFVLAMVMSADLFKVTFSIAHATNQKWLL